MEYNAKSEARRRGKNLNQRKIYFPFLLGLYHNKIHPIWIFKIALYVYFCPNNARINLTPFLLRVVSFERWCRLRGNLLFYFKTRDQWSEPVGVIVLEHCTIKVNQAPPIDGPFGFHIGKLSVKFPLTLGLSSLLPYYSVRSKINLFLVLNFHSFKNHAFWASLSGVGQHKINYKTCNMKSFVEGSIYQVLASHLTILISQSPYQWWNCRTADLLSYFIFYIKNHSVSFLEEFSNFSFLWDEHSVKTSHDHGSVFSFKIKKAQRFWNIKTKFRIFKVSLSICTVGGHYTY